MRRRINPPKKSPVPGLEIVRIKAPARLITLEDPSAAPTRAQDAFARLRPPEGTSGDAIASWRDLVARVALAVRVVAPPRAALVPMASTRVDAGERVGSVREEALALATETDDDAVVALVTTLLDEVSA
jgi:hypothetical protein